MDPLDDSTDNALDKANQYQKEVLQKVFPKAHFSESSVFGSMTKEINSCASKISSGNLFQETKYELTGKNDLLHFTSLNSLIQIMRSGYFRMSDFNCLDDDQELNYSLKKVKDLMQYQERIDEAKDRLFCFSACESNENTITNHFMWELYADSGRGCSIEFELTKKNPYQFLIGKVQYGENEFHELNEIIRLSEKFKQENNGFHIQNLPSTLTNILVFHKSESYDIEDEVRLVYYQDGSMAKSLDNLNIYKDLYRNQKVRQFLKIYLKGKHPFIPHKDIDDDQILDISPQIEIKRIILGAKINSDRIFELVSLINEVKAENNYDFEIWKMDLEKKVYKIN